MIGPCKKEKQELLEAQKQLENHIENPLDWDTSSEEFSNQLTQLRKIVAEKEIALKECEANN